MSQRQRRAARKLETRRSETISSPRPTLAASLPPDRALALPFCFILALLGLALLPAVRLHPRLLWSFLAAATALLTWNALLLAVALRRTRTLVVRVELRAQHYMQACAQGAVLVYWGWYWRDDFTGVYLVVAQLVFAYAFDALLTWSKQDIYTIGFGPFPIIFSTNLFLWFKPDYFYLQFLMVGVGFAAKAFIRWNKDGRKVHIFNPSSFTLGVFSLGLILTGTTSLTWGPEIARTQLLPPHIYLLIFLVALPGQFLFGVASMTLSAVATTYGFGLVYHALTGAYYFFEPSIPIAVFLSMHLLFTDPSTSPRTELGRFAFGVLYGLGVVVTYALLVRVGAPPFYDKLLPVPVLNLVIQLIDRAARSNLLKTFDPGALVGGGSRRVLYGAYIAVWVVIFTSIQVATATPVALARADMEMSVGKLEDAIASYRELLRGSPDHVTAHNKLGFALLQAGRLEDAQVTLRRAIELQSNDATTHNNLGLVLTQSGRPAEAVSSFEHALTLKPDYAEAHYNLAHAYNGIGRPSAAVSEFRKAIDFRPDWPTAMGALAWTESTNGDDGVYNPADAVRLATRAAELSGRKDVPILDALAAAYAASGQLSEATKIAEGAAVLADSSAPNLAPDIRARLALYRAGKPLIEVAR